MCRARKRTHTRTHMYYPRRGTHTHTRTHTRTNTYRYVEDPERFAAKAAECARKSQEDVYKQRRGKGSLEFEWWVNEKHNPTLREMLLTVSVAPETDLALDLSLHTAWA